jgi:hypothetical protein
MQPFGTIRNEVSYFYYSSYILYLTAYPSPKRRFASLHKVTRRICAADPLGRDSTSDRNKAFLKTSMKIVYLLIGLLLGGVASFFGTKSWYQTPSLPSAHRPTQAKGKPVASRPTWQWPDNLDARTAAATSHKVVYEDSTVRILQVVLQAKKTEPVHTHQWRSVMWFTQATPMVYYQYGLVNKQLVLQDSIPIAQMPAAVLNQGAVVEAEGPHAIKNASTHAGLAYRVEFKQVLAP